MTILLRSSLTIAALLLGGCLTMDGSFDLGRSSPDSILKADDRVNASYWLQQSAEYDGVANMAYNIARLRLDQALADRNWTASLEQSGTYQDLPPAIILDVDETVLDNTRMNVHLLKTGTKFSPTIWNGFVESASSPAIPGAVEFTNYAAKKGVTVFYVTNRRAPLKTATRRNLAAQGFPLKENTDTLLLKNERENWGTEKGTRRAFIAENYRILLLVGDNLGDFTDGILSTPEVRERIVAQNRERFGLSWIVLPNPVYGSWENSAHNFKSGLSLDERRQLLVERMEEWLP